MTATTFEEERAAIFAAGCDDFLGKPFYDADIFDLMHKHLGVRYIYAEDSKVARSQGGKEKSQISDLKSQIKHLPSDVLANLEHATILGDAKLIEQAIQEIRDHNTSFANTLTQLANMFDYDEILRIVSESRDSHC